MGLGWNRTLKDGDIIVWKNGLTGGFSAFIGFNPEKHIGIILLTNVSLFEPFYVDSAVLQFLLSVQ